MATVLVIEDEAAIRQRIADQLSRAGFEVETAEDGLVGIEKARRLMPSIILCDITLPRLNGIAVLCVLRDELAEAGSRIIMLTAVEEPSSQRLVQRLGAHGWISKPIAGHALLAAVRARPGAAAAAPFSVAV